MHFGRIMRYFKKCFRHFIGKGEAFQGLLLCDNSIQKVLWVDHHWCWVIHVKNMTTGDTF